MIKIKLKRKISKSFYFQISIVILLIAFLTSGFFPEKVHFSIPVVEREYNIALAQKPIELTKERTETSKTFFSGFTEDGMAKYVWEGQTGPIHYKKNPENSLELWKEIDTTLKPSENSFYNWQMEEAGYSVYFKENFNKEKLVKFESQNHWLEIEPQELNWVSSEGKKIISFPQEVYGKVNENKIYWEGAYGKGLDFEWQAETTKIVKNLIIKDLKFLPKPENEEAILELNLNFKFSERIFPYINNKILPEGEYKNSDPEGIIEFKNETGKRLWIFLPLKYWDSNESLKKEGISKSLISYNHPSFNLSIQIPYFSLKPLTYPVFIDATVDKQVSASADDSYHYGGYWSNSGNTFSTGEISGQTYSSAARFTGVTLPSNATILQAYLTLTADVNDSGTTVRTIIKAEDAASPAQYGASENFESRTYISTTTVHWDSLGAWTAGTEYNSDDISAIIETLLDYYSYDNGAMAFLWDDDGSDSGAHRISESYDGDSTKSPKLYISFARAYDFNDTGHWAGDMGGSPSSPNDSGLEGADSTEYENVKVDDNADYWVTSKQSSIGSYDSQVYRFYIDEPENTVTKITPLWNGHSSYAVSGHDLSLLIWNYDDTSWETVQSAPDGSTSDINLTSDITTNIGSYIDTDEEISLWARYEHYYENGGECPTIYSFNEKGEEVLEEETILGLINKRMEKYHYEDLEYAFPKENKLNIIVKEEMEEIAFFNDIKLIVVDSKADKIYIAPNGIPQAITNLQPVISCKSKRGENCLKQISKQDSKTERTIRSSKGGAINFRENWRETAWTTESPHLLDFSNNENLRDWIEVELPKAPPDAKTAKLVVSASETGVLSYAEVDWVTTSKENVELFFDLSDNTPFGDHWAEMLYSFVPPKIQVQNDNGEWINYPDSSFDENIYSTYDTLVFPLDLSLIKNNKIRIESMAYTYIYDFVGVDYFDSEFKKNVISPSAATHKEKNVVNKINNFDAERIILLPQEQLELSFSLPPESPSLNRTYHIQIAGYYQPKRRLKDEDASFFKDTLNQIREKGIFNFIKSTISESYDLIMTSSNFNYANKRFLTKYLDFLNKNRIDPDETFPIEPFLEKNSISSDYVKVNIEYTPTISVNVSDGSVAYGVLNSNATTSTVFLGDTQVITNNSTVAVDINVMSSDAVGGTAWNLADSAGSDAFVHKFSNNGGSSWTTFPTDHSYSQLKDALAVDATTSLDLWIQAPTASSDYQQKSINVTVQAVAD